MVYFVQCTVTGRVKIGKSNDPQRRLRSIKTGSPTPLILLGTAPGDRRRESRLHSDLRTSRLHGEWFAPTEEVRGRLEELGLEPLDFEWEDRFERVARQEAEKRHRREVGSRRWREMYGDAEKLRALRERFYDAMESWAEIVRSGLRLTGQRPTSWRYDHRRGDGPLHVSSSLRKDHRRAVAALDGVLDGPSQPEPGPSAPSSREADVIPLPTARRSRGGAS